MLGRDFHTGDVKGCKEASLSSCPCVLCWAVVVFYDGGPFLCGVLDMTVTGRTLSSSLIVESLTHCWCSTALSICTLPVELAQFAGSLFEHPLGFQLSLLLA